MNETQFYTFVATGPISTLVIVMAGAPAWELDSRLTRMEAAANRV